MQVSQDSGSQGFSFWDNEFSQCIEHRQKSDPLSTRVSSLVSHLNLSYSSDTDQTLVHTANYNMLTHTHNSQAHLLKKSGFNSSTENLFC